MGSNVEVSCKAEVDTNMRNGGFALSSGVRLSAPGRSVQLDIEAVRSAVKAPLGAVALMK